MFQGYLSEVLAPLQSNIFQLKLLLSAQNLSQLIIFQSISEINT